jgi:hypothetical protein
MSSFEVSDGTINGVVSWFYLRQMGNAQHCSGAWKLQNSGYNLCNEEGQQRLADEMRQLNTRATHHRYNQQVAAPGPHPYRFTSSITRIQAIKFLDCWLYQCSEDATYQDPLFLLMSEVRGLVAGDIVRDMPEYEAAKYDA